MKRSMITILAAAVTVLPACDDDGKQTESQGMLRVTVYGEEYIEDEIPAADVIDGWRIQFSTFLVGLDGIEADGTPVPGAWVFDLTQASGGRGHEVDGISMPAGVVEHLDYRVGPMATVDGGNATDSQIEMMTSLGYGVYVEGMASKGARSLSFAWGFSGATRYVQCETAQELQAGAEAVSQITIHADHLFYDDLDSPDPNVAFDLIASADADGDANVTVDELRAVDITGQTRYQVGSRDITDLWSFVEAQIGTLGHIDGEGHCEIGS